MHCFTLFFLAFLNIFLVFFLAFFFVFERFDTKNARKKHKKMRENVSVLHYALGKNESQSCCFFRFGTFEVKKTQT